MPIDEAYETWADPSKRSDENQAVAEAHSPMIFNSCPRCRGAIYSETDIHGSYLGCSSCGQSWDLNNDGTFMVPLTKITMASKRDMEGLPDQQPHLHLPRPAPQGMKRGQQINRVPFRHSVKALE